MNATGWFQLPDRAESKWRSVRSLCPTSSTAEIKVLGTMRTSLRKRPMDADDVSSDLPPAFQYKYFTSNQVNWHPNYTPLEISMTEIIILSLVCHISDQVDSTERALRYRFFCLRLLARNDDWTGANSTGVEMFSAEKVASTIFWNQLFLLRNGLQTFAYVLGYLWSVNDLKEQKIQHQISYLNGVLPLSLKFGVVQFVTFSDPGVG